MPAGIFGAVIMGIPDQISNEDSQDLSYVIGPRADKRWGYREDLMDFWSPKPQAPREVPTPINGSATSVRATPVRRGTACAQWQTTSGR